MANRSRRGNSIRMTSKERHRRKVLETRCSMDQLALACVSRSSKTAVAKRNRGDNSKRMTSKERHRREVLETSCSMEQLALVYLSRSSRTADFPLYSIYIIYINTGGHRSSKYILPTMLAIILIQYTQQGHGSYTCPLFYIKY